MNDANATVRNAKLLAERFLTLGENMGNTALEIALAACVLRHVMRNVNPLLRAGTDAFEADQVDQESVRLEGARLLREISDGN